MNTGGGSKFLPTPYVWAPQPQRGTAAGASQDYSTRMNWMSAGPTMIAQVNRVREARNAVLQREALQWETPRAVLNPPVWPAQFIDREPDPPTVLTLPRNDALEREITDDGGQLAGGGVFGLWSGRPAHRWAAPRAGRIKGLGLQLNDEHLSFSSPPEGVLALPAWTSVRADGAFQLGGSGPLPAPGPIQWLTLQNAPSVPRSGGIGERQFVSEFVPVPYLNPFSGPPGTYPDQFQSNYDIVSGRVQGYD